MCFSPYLHQALINACEEHNHSKRVLLGWAELFIVLSSFVWVYRSCQFLTIQTTHQHQSKDKKVSNFVRKFVHPHATLTFCGVSVILITKCVYPNGTCKYLICRKQAPPHVFECAVRKMNYSRKRKLCCLQQYTRIPTDSEILENEKTKTAF